MNIIKISKSHILSFVVALFVLVMIMAFSQLANASDRNAGGGKVESWQRTGELPTANLPTTLNLETCTLLSETEWSTTWQCDSFIFGTFTVVEPKD